MIMLKRLSLVALSLFAHLSAYSMQYPERSQFGDRLYPECGFDLTCSRESRERNDQLCHLASILKPMNNWHDPIPDDNAPLDEKHIATPFWSDLKQRSQQEKDAAFAKHTLDGHFGTASWYLLRYHIAAGVVIAGANPNTRGKGIGGVTPLWYALCRKDEPLTNLLLSHGADPKLPHSMTGSTPGDTLIFSAKTVAQAKALIKYGATIDVKDVCGRTVLHNAVNESDFEPALVSYYVSLGGESLLRERVTLDRREFAGGDALYQLTALEYFTQNFTTTVESYSSALLKTYLDEFKKAGTTHEEIVAASTKLREKRDSFLSKSQSAYDEYTKDEYTKRLIALEKYIASSKN